MHLQMISLEVVFRSFHSYRSLHYCTTCLKGVRTSDIILCPGQARCTRSKRVFFFFVKQTRSKRVLCRSCILFYLAAPECMHDRANCSFFFIRAAWVCEHIVNCFGCSRVGSFVRSVCGSDCALCCYAVLGCFLQPQATCALLHSISI
jgi:hypothetical protein